MLVGCAVSPVWLEEWVPVADANPHAPQNEALVSDGMFVWATYVPRYETSMSDSAYVG